MASLKSQGTSSPSASSIFLPLGRRSRRGSHASMSSQTERENLNEALDQIHTAACQSDSLTVFNEFTSPPASSSVSENKGLTGDLPGGLSGLYNRFRASVGGVKDIVGGSAKQSEVSSPDNITAKSPNTDTFHSKPSSASANTGPPDGSTPLTGSGQGSKLHSPVAGTFGGPADGSAHASTVKSSKISSKTTSVSSKASVGTPAIKSPVGPLTKSTKYTAADPTVTELHVNAIKDSSIPHTRSNSGSVSTHAFPSSDSLNQERSDNIAQASKSQSSLDPASRRSHSPVLTTRPSNDPYKDGRYLPTSSRAKSSNENPSEIEKTSGQGFNRQDHNGIPELDTSFTGSSWKNQQMDDVQELVNSPQEYQTANLSKNNAPDNSNPPTARTSLSKFSNDQSSTYEGRTPTTLMTSLSLTDGDHPSSHSSRTSLKNPRDNLATRFSQPRLPGFGISRATPTPSESTASRSTAGPQQSVSTSREAGRTGNNPPDQRWKYPASGDSGINQKNNAMSQLRSKLLSRDFWMRDENAKDCFHCGEPFTTFRRKHHCRTCGQIFDAKCTLLISGADFGNSSSIRVCKPCEAMINSRDDDSSEFSGEELSPVVFNHSTPDNGSRSQTQGDDDDTSSIVSQPFDHVMKTPTMAIPATRRAGEGNSRRSAILEFDPSDRASLRPTSSRSVKSSMSLRPHSMGHKRHHSRHQYIRSFKSYHEERAPFQRGAGEDMSRENRLSAFHRDSIIDPDLAQYLSDDASSGDEAPNLFSAVSDGALSKGGDGERTHLGGFLSAVRKGRSRIGEKGKASGLNSGRDMDDGSISSSRAVNFHRPSRRRNLSVASSVHQKLSPRASKDNTSAIPNLQDHPVPSLNLGPSYNSSGFKMTRSSSMRGAGAPALELNRASLQHVQNLLRQLLDDASVAHVKSWETALVPILLKVTDDVDPDVQRGDDMDIRHYVKLKRIPGGRPGDTSYVSGLVFTKNLALKSMPRSISRPNILIITFALEYARHEQHFMSLEPVIRQEREFLENLVSRIAALRPHLLLVEKHVSGLALQYLEKANIATAYNVKPAVLEAVSRCCQTRIITSMDKLATTPEHTGQCGSFDLKTYVHNGRKKTYMYLSGCPKELGCTIVLRGAEDDVLLKIKRIMEFMVYVVYNLKLETCLMRDEFAQIPSSTSDEITSKRDPPSSVEQPKLSNMETVRNLADNAEADGSQTTSEISKSQEHNVSEERRLPAASEGSDLPDDVPMPTFYEDMVEKQQTKILSASPFVKFMQPYLLMRARELERRLAYLKRLRDQDFSVDQAADEKSQTKKFVLITPEMIHESLAGASSKVKEVLHAVHDAEYDRALHNYQTQKRQWETYVAGNINLFDPYSHQNIVVLHSLVCTTTSIPCSGPDVFALGFYNEHESDRAFEADCTLGQYVEDLCQSANAVCTANGCEKRMLEHHRQYVHGEAQVSVFVQPYPAKMRGLQDTILMWSCCKICGNETQVMPMSDSTWKYSFGKYLELSFWSRNLHARAGVCPHDLHRDHLRYFGFKDVALRFHYDPIKLLEIIVPRPRVTWKVENDLKLKNEVYLRTEKRVNRFMSSVKARLKSINVQSVMPELAEACKQEIDVLTKRANDEHAALTKQLQESYMDSRYWEVIPLNKAVRATQEKVVEWDAAFAEFEKNFFPSEKDIKRMATLQLKRIFLDKDVSVTSLTSPDEATITPAEEEVDETSPTTTEPPRKRSARRMTLSPEKAQDVLVSVVEEQSGKNNKDKIKTIEEVPSPKPKAEDRQSPYSSPPLRAASQEEVRHLDLAVPSSLSEKLSGTPPAPGIKSNASSRAPSPAPIPENKSLPNVPGAVDIPVERQANGETKSPDELASNGDPTTPSRQRSGIPRLSDGGGFRRVSNKARSPPLFRAQSQPAHLHRKNSGSSPMSAFKSGFGSSNGKQGDTIASSPGETKPKVPEKRLSDRFGLGALKTSKLTSGHSLIPRSVPGKQPNRRVSTLAKHFEQLSREFEKERFKDRQQRVAKGRQSRAYPMASSKPIVEVYKNVQDAVAEREPSIGEEPPSPTSPAAETNDIAAELAREAKPESHVMDGQTGEPTATDTPKPEDKPQELSQTPSEVDADEYRSDEDRSLMSELHSVESPEDTAAESPEESFKLSPEEEFPKHEQSSLVKLLANFWAERSASGWKPLDYPLNVSEHVFADCDIIVREDEPSSVIAFALNSDVYKANLASIQENDQVFEKKVDPDAESNGDNQAEVEHSLLRATGTHLKYQFQEGQAKMLCKVFYAGQFDALRRKCGVSERIVESFSRCMKWDSRGGKTKSLFLKTLDERFILKSLSTIETQAFLKFAPAYFQIMSEALFHELPSAIAKMFGFYQVIIKNPVTGVEFNWFLLVMENLFYDRVPNRIFDLKGSMRNRKVQSTGERNEVLLDENMVEFIYESPLFTREHSKKLLSQSVWNDTLFLGRQNVMDYSLMIAIDESRQELVVGIIDCIRTYTWDKKLESWIKDRGFTGGGKNRPTVTSPKEYKSRFREAMARYVLHAPNCWHAIQASRIDRRPLRMEYQNGDARRDGVIENIDEPNV